MDLYGNKELDGTTLVDYSDSENEHVTQSLRASSESSIIRSTCPSSATFSKQDLSEQDLYEQEPCEQNLPKAVNDFFQTMPMDCFPKEAGIGRKAQPWREMWVGPQKPSADGKLMIAFPKNCVWGSGQGLGGY